MKWWSTTTAITRRELVAGHVPLRRGLHKFRLRYFQSEGGETLSVGWAAADGELQPLAGPALVH